METVSISIPIPRAILPYMVCCCQSTVGSSNSAIGVSQTLKCLGGGHLVDEMSVDVEENSRIIFFVYDMVLEDFVVESAGTRTSRWHNFGILVVCVAEKDGSSLILVQSSIDAPLASIAGQCKKKHVELQKWQELELFQSWSARSCRCALRSSDLAPSPQKLLVRTLWIGKGAGRDRPDQGGIREGRKFDKNINDRDKYSSQFELMIADHVCVYELFFVDYRPQRHDEWITLPPPRRR